MDVNQLSQLFQQSEAARKALEEASKAAEDTETAGARSAEMMINEFSKWLRDLERIEKKTKLT